MTQLKAVLFDLDGTLLDSAPDIRQAVNHMLAEEGRALLSLDQVKSMVGDGVMELCRRALEATGGVKADDLYPFVQRFVSFYRNLPPDPAQVFPSAHSVLDELRQAGVKLAVCTNKPESATAKILESLDLIRYFAFLAGGDTFPIHKPNPEHITRVLDALDVKIENAVFVGDGPNDVAASRAAKMPCIVVTHGYGQDYDSMTADRLIPDLASLLPLLREMGWGW